MGDRDNYMGVKGLSQVWGPVKGSKMCECVRKVSEKRVSVL